MPNKDLIFDFFLILLIGLTILLPTGSVYGLQYKFFIVGILILLYGYFNFSGLPFARWNIVIVAFCFFLSWHSLIALLNYIDINSVLSHLSAFISVFSLIFFILLRVLTSQAKSLIFINFIVYFLFAYTILKLILSLAIFTNYVEYYDVVAFWEDVFGYVFIGLDAAIFFRIHLAVDYLYVPVLFYLLLININFRLRGIVIAFILAGVLISYSRILYFNILMLLLLYLFYSFGRSSFVKIYWYFLLFTAAVFYMIDDIVIFLTERFFGGYADISDITRVQMYESLLNFAADYLLFGAGMGSHAHFIRYDNLPWYYELQWLSFVGQFGIVSASLLIMAAFFPVFYFKVNSVEWKFLSLVYLGWVLVGVFNGFMLTSSAGIIFSTFVMLFSMVADRYKLPSLANR